MEELMEKIYSKRAKIGVIGLGYVGLPMVIEFCKAGFSVIGFDIDSEKVEKLRQGISYISYIPSKEIQKYLDRFEPTTDFSLLSEVDCILICVPTPLNENREPDMRYVFNTAQTIAKYLRKGQLIVLESTTYPGTTDEDLREILEKTGLKAGEDFYLGYSPERVDPNNKEFSFYEIPKVVSGYSERCLRLVKALYVKVVARTVPVSSTKVAEACKLYENIYRAVNIALVNELKMLFDRMGIDIWEVIEASKTKPFGFQAFYPGPGLGGHCIPIDPFYLTWKAIEYDFSTRFIELAGEINTSMPYYVVQKTIEVLNKHRKTLNGANVLILGLAYKRDVDDPRESPSLKIMKILKEYGANVLYNDPYIPECKNLKHYPNFNMKSVELTEDLLRSMDVVLLITDHSIYDYAFIEKNAKLIIDTRNAFRRNGIISQKVFLA